MALSVEDCRYNGAESPTVVLPGDALMAGLAVTRPQLRVLRMTGERFRFQGVGTCPGASAAAGGLPGMPLLRALELDGSRLLRGRIQDLGSLRNLRRLTLHNVTRKVGAITPHIHVTKDGFL